MLLKLHDIQINYKLYKSKKTNTDQIVLIHGLGLDLTTWEHITPHLQKDFNVLVFDMRGHGETKGNTENISWSVLVEDLNQLVSHVNFDRFYIVGLGIGGNLAIKMNEFYPGKVNKLILTSVFIHFPKTITEKEMEKRAKLLTNGKMSKLARQMIAQICVSPSAEMETLLTKAYGKIDQKTYYELFEMLTKTFSLNELDKIDKEVLLIQGDRDPLFPIQQTSLYQSHLNYSFSYIVPNSSNMVPIDNPDTFLKLIAHFIQEKDTTSFSTILEKQFTENLEEIFLEEINQEEPLEIYILDGFSVSYKGNQIIDKWNQRKAKNLLAYLAYSGTATRDQLIDEFWYESDLTKARNNLRVSLTHLRSILHRHDLEHFLIIDRETITLQAPYTFDLTNYLQLLKLCKYEENRNQKKILFDTLMKQCNKRSGVAMYDNWIQELYNNVEIQLSEISQELN